MGSSRSSTRGLRPIAKKRRLPELGARPLQIVSGRFGKACGKLPDRAGKHDPKYRTAGRICDFHATAASFLSLAEQFAQKGGICHRFWLAAAVCHRSKFGGNARQNAYRSTAAGGLCCAVEKMTGKGDRPELSGLSIKRGRFNEESCVVACSGTCGFGCRIRIRG